MRAEMFTGGTLTIMDPASIDPPCPPTSTVDEQIIGSFDDDAATPYRACFTGDWTGDFSFFQDTISDIEVRVNTLDSQSKTFDVNVILPSCEAPSTNPTFFPSSVPSN